MLKNLLKTFDKTTCFSKSGLWAIIAHHYHQSGHSAWERNIPYIVTNSTLTAHHHAHCILNHAQTMAYKKHGYLIIDYGAGIGQHACSLAQQLTTLSLSYQIPLDMFVICMADLSPGCIHFWETHPDIAPFIRTGLIKTRLLSGHWLTDIQHLCDSDAIYHCLIANYLLDSMPFMAYEYGQQQGLSLSAPRKYLTPEFSGPLSSVTLKTRPLIQPLAHPFPELIDRYLSLSRYTIPTTAIAFVHAFFQHSQHGIMLINDKTFYSTDHMAYDHNFNLTFEGSFSATVNLDALITTLPKHLHSQLISTHYPTLQTVLLSHQPQTLPPYPSCSDAASLFNHYKQTENIPAATCISLAVFMQHDPFCLETFSQAIVPDNTSSEQVERMIHACLNNRFAKPVDYVFLHAAKIMRRLSDFSRSQHYLDQHSQIYSIDAAYHLEAGILYHCIGKLKEAKKSLTYAAKDPKTKNTANTLLKELLAQDP